MKLSQKEAIEKYEISKPEFIRGRKESGIDPVKEKYNNRLQTVFNKTDITRILKSLNLYETEIEGRPALVRIKKYLDS